MARLAPDLPDSYSASLKALKSMGAVVLVISLDRQLTQYYWHNLPKEAGFPFLALVEHTNYIGPEHYGGDHIIYCGDYLNPDHEYFSLSKEELLERFLPALKRVNPDFDRSWVKDTWLWKTSYAQPVPPVNHSKNIPPLRTPVPGLYFASMSQVYPWDRGTNFAVEIGRKVAGTCDGRFRVIRGTYWVLGIRYWRRSIERAFVGRTSMYRKTVRHMESKRTRNTQHVNPYDTDATLRGSHVW